MTNNLNGLLSIKEAANYLGISPWTAYSWVSKGLIPRVKLGRRCLFRKEDLDQMIEANTGYNGKHKPQLQTGS